MSNEEIQQKVDYFTRVLEELETLDLDREEGLVYNFCKTQAELQRDLVQRPEFKMFKRLGMI